MTGAFVFPNRGEMTQTRPCKTEQVSGIEFPLSVVQSPFCFQNIFLKIFYLCIFRQRGRERERETSMCGCLSNALSWDLAHNPGMCRDWELNLRPFGSQAGAQSTEPYQPGCKTFLSPPNETLSPLNSYCFRSQPLASTNLLPVSVDLTILDTS